MELSCPTCSAQDWKSRQEQVTRSFKVCANCGYSPLTTTGERLTEANLDHLYKSLREIMDGKVVALEEALTTYAANQDSPDAVILNAKIKKAERELSMADRRFMVIDKLVEILGIAPAEGMLTLHLPELGVFTQCTWGGYDLLKGLERGVTDLALTHPQEAS